MEIWPPQACCMFALVVALASSAAAACGDDPTSISGWLCRIVVPLPAISISSGEIDVSVNDLHCGNMSVGNLSSAKITSQRADGPSYSLAVLGTSIYCTSPNVKFVRPIPLTTSMTISLMDVGFGSTIDVGLDNASHAVQSSRGTSASVGHIDVSVLHLPAWLLSPVVELFKSEISANLVTAFDNLVETNGSAVSIGLAVVHLGHWTQ
uniref:Lipid-binding serum glycoprotein N-terminal domain-containing protein n=2 Tax=Prymnesium polylepis TaxID=72548 RepID=A0A6V4R855_9EUKA|mmetsp:Transcript_42778/g.106671  ORF Transcript_42778/g.106671 Transcript_42778/m.106671 type:complete len:208 (+) Transcript_42778:541-1164(+)